MALKPHNKNRIGKATGAAAEKALENAVTWDLVQQEYMPHHPTDAATLRLRRATHRTIKRVVPDIEQLLSNTALSALHDFIDLMGQAAEEGDVEPPAWEEARDTLLLLLAPTNPGSMEKLWHQLGKPDSIHAQPHLVYDEELAQDESPSAGPIR